MTRYRGTYAEYEDVSTLGEGVYGQTIKAEVIDVFPSSEREQPRLNKEQLVVIKMPNIDETRDPKETIMYLKDVSDTYADEYSSLRRLDDIEGVAHILDHGNLPVKINSDFFLSTFLVQELIEGLRFDEYLKTKYPNSEGEFQGISDPEAYFNLAEKLVRLVRLIHQNRVIHGDIWPNNIMMQDDQPVLIDFGGAVLRDFRFSVLDKLGQKPNPYRPRERQREYGEGGGYRQGRRSDIFSLGGVLYYMATGEDPPPTDPDIDVLKNNTVLGIQQCNRELLEKNCAVADIIARCRRYSKDDRIANTDDLLAEIRTFSFKLASEIQNTNLNQIISRLKESIEKLEREGLSFFAGSVELELGTRASRIEDMSYGIYDLSGDHETLVSTMCRYLSILGSGDLLYIRCFPHLWYPLNLGINGRFLAMTKLLAERGTTVIILFHTCDEDRADSKIINIFNIHRKVVKELTEKKNFKGKFKVYFQEVLSAFRTQELYRGWQRATIIHKDKTSIFEPICDQKKVVRSVRFLSKGEQKTRLISTMNKEIASATEIAQWFAGSKDDITPDLESFIFPGMSGPDFDSPEATSK